MGCICSKGSSVEDYAAENNKDDEVNKCSTQVIAPLEKTVIQVTKPPNDGSVQSKSKPVSETSVVAIPVARVEDSGKTIIIERPKGGHHRRSTTIDFTFSGRQQTMTRIISMPHGPKAEQTAAGWPSWLSSVAGEAIRGWVPRSAESFQKLNKIGQGTYSSVYQARDLTTNKIVAMKKVRFVNMDPESVRFMAREICILRRLDHPNVMKLEALVTSKISGSLYLVFEYMEHDLAGLLASPKVKFTEPQIKCYMQQFFRGLEHCHSRGILHRDIKGANLLVDSSGVLKIGDFGLAKFFQPNQKEPLTSRAVTLWYRAPELLLGATDYGVAIDMWSAGCILAELFAGKPIMPGRTEVEQMHKIFKLCGSPSEEYWRKSKLPHATSFKPQQPYRRRVSETFKEFPSIALALIDVLLSIEPEARGTATSALNSEFFTKEPRACAASDLPKYPPSKEFDTKSRDEEARRQKAEIVNGRGGESIHKSSRPSKGVPSPELDDQGQRQPSKSISVKYKPSLGHETGYTMQPRRGNSRSGLIHSSSVLHPNAVGHQWSAKGNEASQTVSVRNFGSSRHGRELTDQGSHRPQGIGYSSSVHQTRDDRGPGQETMVYVQKRNRIHYSGPLMPPGGNMEDIFKEHERQIQEAVRKARGDKSKAK